jgi:hypothetical protein
VADVVCRPAEGTAISCLSGMRGKGSEAPRCYQPGALVIALGWYYRAVCRADLAMPRLSQDIHGRGLGRTLATPLTNAA